MPILVRLMTNEQHVKRLPNRPVQVSQLKLNWLLIPLLSISGSSRCSILGLIVTSSVKARKISEFWILQSNHHRSAAKLAPPHTSGGGFIFCVATWYVWKLKYVLCSVWFCLSHMVNHRAKNNSFMWKIRLFWPLLRITILHYMKYEIYIASKSVR